MWWPIEVCVPAATDRVQCVMCEQVWLKSHGGPMREGLQLRITHVDGSIGKLEIARQYFR
jgi:hypothetical protein